MPKKKKNPIEGIGRDPENKLIVQKSKPLFELWRSNFTLAEFKIMDMYLARINTHEPEKRTVKLTKGQLENALGVTRINRPDLEQRLKNLYSPIDLAKGDRKRFHLVTLFEEAEAEQDDDGVWQITLTCTNAAMKYIFTDLEKLGYLRYKLRSVSGLTSRYTYILFLYLESNRKFKTWTVPLSELKKTLKCEDDASYDEFKIFNQRILKKCQKEIHEKTECRFTYEPIRKGRSVASIRFTLETIADLFPEPDEELDGQQQLPWFDQRPDDPLALLSEACNGEFSREEIQEIFTIISTKTADQLPVAPGHPGDIEFSRYHYLAQMYARMNVQASRKKIPHRFEYFVKMLENDK